MLCMKKYEEDSLENALFDASGHEHNAEITDEEKHGASILPVRNQLILVMHQRPGPMLG